MGMNAYVLGIGKFKKRIAHCLEYPKDYYSDTEDGVSVFSNHFHCETSEKSRELAEVFSINPLDFNAHKLNRFYWRVDNWLDIRNQLLHWLEFSEEDVDNFFELMNDGFEFYYRPEA